MTLLVLGASGMVGQALVSEAGRRGMDVIGAARHGADMALDVYQDDAVHSVIDAVKPDLLINCAAITDIAACEADPAQAYMINARAVSIMAEACAAGGSRFIQMSTDHYYTGDGAAKHSETVPVTLVNEYARTKYAGEGMAGPEALVVRTNVTGFRGWPGRPTFIEWAIEAIRGSKPVTPFDDFYTSTIDALSLSVSLLDLATNEHAKGILNVASRNVVSKKEFLYRLAEKLGHSLEGSACGSVKSMTPRRAESLGLDVSRAEEFLGRQLPDTDQVIDALLKEQEIRHAV